MNDIKDLLISRISDIKVLLQQQLKISHTQNHSQLAIPTNNNIRLSENPNSYDTQECIDYQSPQYPSPNNVSPSNSNSGRFNSNQRSNKVSALIKKKQKGRNYKEEKLFNSGNMLSFHSDRQVQELYFNCIDVFASFDQDFAKYKNPAHFLTLSMAQNLKKVFCYFFLKHQQPQKSKQLIPEIMGRQICDLSPAFFLGCIKKWSASILNSLLNLNEDKNQCKIDIKVDLRKIQDKILNRNFVFESYVKEDKNNFNFITKNKSPRESVSKPQNQQTYKKSNSFRTIVNNILTSVHANQVPPQITVNSKEMVYSYCLDDLKKYYKSLPLQDLDIGYLRNIKKMGKKQDLLSSQNIKNTVQVLVQSKNCQIKNLMLEFQSQYAKFKEIKGLSNPKIQQKRQSQQTKITKSQNETSEKEKNQNLNQKSLKDLSIKNLKSLFELNSKLLTPSHNQRQSYKNRIKFNKVKNEQILCQNLSNLTGQMTKQGNHERYFQNQQNDSNIIDYNSVLTQQISQETSQIENKIKLLKRINKKNKDLKEKYVEGKIKLNCQQRNPENELINFFVDEHIESIEKVSKLPKILPRDKTIDYHPQSTEDIQSNHNYSLQKRNHEYSLQHHKHNSSSIVRQSKLLFKQPHRGSQQFSVLITKKGLIPQKPTDQPNLNRRFMSEAAEKEAADKTSIDDNERPLSNFSFKSKAFGTSKKSSFNAIKLTKNKTSLKNQFGQIQSIQSIHEKIKNKFGLKQNTTFDMIPKTPSNIFSSQKKSFQSQANKDDFIKYLKNLQNQKNLSQKLKCSPSKQKQRSIKKKFT